MRQRLQFSSLSFYDPNNVLRPGVDCSVKPCGEVKMVEPRPPNGLCCRGLFATVAKVGGFGGGAGGGGGAIFDDEGNITMPSLQAATRSRQVAMQCRWALPQGLACHRALQVLVPAPRLDCERHLNEIRGRAAARYELLSSFYPPKIRVFALGCSRSVAGAGGDDGASARFADALLTLHAFGCCFEANTLSHHHSPSDVP